MQENRQKLWRLIEGCETGVLVTAGADGFAHARTMERITVPQAEEIWFATEGSERKLAEIELEPKVTVFYSHPDKSWACVYGVAEAVTDQRLKSRFWKEDWDQYWPEGPVSGNYVLIRVVPVAAEYLLLAGYERGRLSFKQGER